MNVLIGTSPLGLAMIKHKNKVIAREGTWHGGKRPKCRTKVYCCKTGSDDRAAADGIPCYDRPAGQRNQSLNCDCERAGITNSEGERLEHLEPTKEELMISKIISRAACLAALSSHPKSFANCPDLHGGVPDLPGGRIYMKPAPDKEKVVPLAIAVPMA